MNIWSIECQRVVAHQWKIRRYRRPRFADDFAARFPMQGPLSRMAKKKFSASAIGAIQRISKLLFVGQAAEMNDGPPLREPRCGREERSFE